jgi:YHS domain-containing protein
VALVAACDSSPPAQPRARGQASSARAETITSVRPHPAPLDPPPTLQDEAPPPKPKTLPGGGPAPIVSAEDERLRASLPFTPAIAMDPVDGSKISLRANTPTLEYKGILYYFANDANKRLFANDPERALRGGYLRM